MQTGWIREGFLEMVTLEGPAVEINADVQIGAHAAAAQMPWYYASGAALLESYNELTGEFSGISLAYHEVPSPCRLVDLNGDGFVEFGDDLEFLNRYEKQDAAVDYNGDGLVDFSDYLLEFLSLYDQCRDF